MPGESEKERPFGSASVPAGPAELSLRWGRPLLYPKTTPIPHLSLSASPVWPGAGGGWPRQVQLEMRCVGSWKGALRSHHFPAVKSSPGDFSGFVSWPWL